MATGLMVTLHFCAALRTQASHGDRVKRLCDEILDVWDFSRSCMWPN